VAVSNYDRFPPEVDRLPRVGGLLDPYVEPLLALKPDLVIVYGTQDELKARLASVGIPMFNYVHRGLADITETMRALGDRIGLHDQADAAARDVEEQLAATSAASAGQRRPRALLIFGRDAGALRHIEASGGYGFLHDLLEVAGADDVLGDIHQAKVDMSTEMILARAPEVIIELHYGDSLRLDLLDAERRVWNALPSLPAVKNHRIHLLVGNEFVVPGPRVVLAARRLAEAVRPR
jgi:iron complex transport system substrate-binding protein